MASSQGQGGAGAGGREYSQFGQNLQNSESNWVGILPSTPFIPSSPYQATIISSSRGSGGNSSSDNFIPDDFLLSEFPTIGSTFHELKGILNSSPSDPTTATEIRNQYTYRGDHSSDLSLKKFITVSIPTYSTEMDSEGKYTSFTVLVHTSFASVHVKRRYKNFLALHQELSLKVPKEILPQLPKKKRLGLFDPLFVEERRSSLEKYLQDLTTLRSCWTCPHFIQFLDDNPPVLFLQMQTAKLNDEVRFLRYQNEVLVTRCEDNATALTSATSMISDLYKRLVDWEDHFKRASYYQPERPREAHYPSERPRESHYPSERPRESHYQNSDVYSSPSHYSESSQTTNHQPFEQSSRTNHHYDVTNDDWKQKSNTSYDSNDHSRYERSDQTIRRRKSLSNIIGSTNILDLLSVCPPSSYFDQFGENILSMILPSYDQLQYRFQVEKFMGKLVRKSLGAQIHQMGIHSLRCFLPDDPISLSIFLCRGLENSWYLRLNEKLCRMSTGVSSSPHPGAIPSPSLSTVSVLGAMSGIAKGLSDLPKPDAQEPTLFGHIISNVSFMDEHGIHSLQCLVANMTIDIRVNEKIDLCFYTFIEEFDRSIGKDHILKKSLVMIRAWWTLEASSYTQTPLSSHYLSNESICIMICSIFNRFHNRIFHPIHALSIFIAEYASFDWASSALTIFGPISRSFLSGECPSPESCLQAFPNSAISLDLLSKYQELANQSPSCDETTYSSLEGATSSEGFSFSSSIKQPEVDAPLPKQRRSMLVSLFERVEFDEENENEIAETQNNPSPRSEPRNVSSDSMKIFHPMDFSVNTVPESMTDEFVAVFTDIMKKAETNIVSILNMIVMIENAAGDQGFYETLDNIFQKFFAVTIARFGQGWKPDLPTSAIAEIAAEAESSMDEFIHEIGRDQLAASLEKMFELIKYSQFLLSAEITEGALKTLSRDILLERGALPVGEVGKMLQEMTGISTLSAYLKDKFGGLKKFLEIFPDDFVISTDHPFNPHVFLRTAVNSDELKLINQGVIPQHMTTKSNKRRPSRKKRLSSGSIQSSLPSELNLSTISYGSGSSARSGSSGMSRSTSPPPGQQQQQGYSPSQLYVTTTPLRPTFYSAQGQVTRFPVSRTHSTNDIAIAPGLSFDYSPHEPFIDEELPMYNPQSNPHPRRRRTVPGSTLNLDVGVIPVAPGIDGTPIAPGLSGYPHLNYSHSHHRGGDMAGGNGAGGTYLPNNIYYGHR